MENTGFSILRLPINDCHQSIQRLRPDCQRLLGELSDLIDCSEVLWIEEFCRSQFRKESIKQREKHDKKLLRLIGTGFVIIFLNQSSERNMIYFICLNMHQDNAC